MSTNPGLRNQAGVRTFFRIAGPLLMVVGGLVLAHAIKAFNTDSFDGPPASAFVSFFGGFLLFAVGLGFLTNGFAGVAARYQAGEIAPVAKDALGYLKDETGDEPASGPFCRRCGTRNDDEAIFCDSCGGRLA